MTDIGGINIEWPKFTPRWEQTNDGPTVTLTAHCAICDAVVTTRTWVRADETPIDNDILHRQGQKDTEAFMEHLAVAHPEEL